MKVPVLYILLTAVVIAFTSVKPGDELKIDWKRITDKDYVVTYVKVVYDSSSQYAIDTKVKIYNTNDGARVFSKSSVKMLKELILNQANFTDEFEEAACKPAYFPNAIVITRHGETEGIINIGCNEKLWNFEPKNNSAEALMLNEKGLKLKEEIFKSIR
ncbi:MAG: hypothetical protein V4677_08660 [Bacteroidota bacterium]